MLEQTSDRLFDGLERSAGKGLEDLLELLKRLAHVLVGLGLGRVNVDVGLLLGLLGDVLDNVGPLVGDRVETIERLLKLGVALDGVDNLLDALEELVLDIVGRLFVEVAERLLGRVLKVVLSLLGTALGGFLGALEVLLARSTDLDGVTSLLALLVAGAQLALGAAAFCAAVAAASAVRSRRRN